ncbi:MAG TPA: RIP metalloprotease RseP [Sutterella sp.]|nr:RIP metalloprotease RseP [Sutterella sp.]
MAGLIGFILAIVILVLVHEWGHYIVARLSGVPVLAFSLGFGPILFRYTDKNGCEWRLSAVPFGGYVKMLSSEEKTALQEEFPNRTFDWSRAFENISVKKRLVIVLAGPMMNLIFAVLVYAGLAMVGSQEVSPRLGTPTAHSQAASLGVQEGWTIRAVDGQPVQSFFQAERLLSQVDAGKSVRVTFALASGPERVLDFYADRAGTQESTPFAFGLMPYMESVVVGRVEAGSAAEAGGLKVGDTILAINGKAVREAKTLVSVIREQGAKPLTLYLRSPDGRVRDVVIKARAEKQESGERVWKIGAVLGSLPETVYLRHGPIESLSIGCERVRSFTTMTLKGIARMVTGSESLKSVAGPVGIGNLAGKTLQIGPYAFLTFLAMLSISLGILNLLPVPILDGGNMVIFLWEWVTGMRPTPVVSMWLTRIGVAFILGLTGLAFFNDIVALFQLD